MGQHSLCGVWEWVVLGCGAGLERGGDGRQWRGRESAQVQVCGDRLKKQRYDQL